MLLVGLVFVLFLADTALVRCDDAERCSGSGIWGTYRPGQYIGVKASVPLSPILGVMYTESTRYDSFNHIRHDCDDRDMMKTFGYEFNDGHCASRHRLQDSFHGVDITSKFLHMSTTEGSGFTLQIEGKKFGSVPIDELSLIWYLSLEDTSHSFSVPQMRTSKTLSLPVDISASFGDLGKFRILASFSDSSQGVETHYSASSPDEFWNVKELVRKEMQHSFQVQLNELVEELRHDYEAKGETKSDRELMREVVSANRLVSVLHDRASHSPSTIVFQHLVKLPFSLNIHFIPEAELLQKNHPQTASMDSGDLLEDDDEDEDESHPQKSSPVIGHRFQSDDWVNSALKASEQAFEKRFQDVFDLHKKGYDAEHREFAMRALNDMLGSIGYFHGDSLHRSRKSGEIESRSAESLTTVVPARAMFPRGFLWDEGFHQLLLARFEPNLSERIISDWCTLIEADGWLPREQILGAEARSRVPAEFQAQDPSMANPPTLLLPIMQLARLSGVFSNEQEISVSGYSAKPVGVDQASKERTINWVKKILPSLRRNVDWYLQSQAAERPLSFRWNKRTEDHCLASGLDDYPRAPLSLLSSTGAEGHVDLHCWMIFSCQAMKLLTEIAGEPSEAYAKKAEDLTVKLDEYHWDETNRFYFDYFLRENATDYEFVSTRGYVNLFPFALGLIDPASDKLESILRFIRDESHVWSKYGIRSLSAQDKDFSTVENYWRGPIWYNMNYLILGSLFNYGKVDGPYQQVAASIYSQLRDNLVENAFNEYRRTSFLWEQYDGKSGEGRRSHPFTGWTALVTLMMAETF